MKSQIRIGSGFDIHRLVSERRLVLGGVEIPSELGLEGHSDADVVLHALCDAILGACGAGDIGVQFPNTDPTFKNIDSTILLERSFAIARQKGWEFVNADISILAERPKLSPYIDQMKARISTILSSFPDQVGIKATTCEGLGAIGRGEGIAAMATVLLERAGS